MKAWSMFAHSVRLVLNNLGVALRISLVLYLVQVSAQVYGHITGVNKVVQGPGGIPVTSVSGGEAVIYLVLSFVAVVASLWVAVAWHRYILLSEVPAGWLPAWPGGKVLGYLGRSILIAIAVVGVLVPVGLVLGLIAPSVLMVAIMVGVGALVTFRLCPILPAAAVGKDMKLGEALRATRDGGGTLFGLAGLVIAGSLLLQLPTIISGDPGSSLSLIYAIVVNWFATMIGVSLLTTIYGHYVEGRQID